MLQIIWIPLLKKIVTIVLVAAVVTAAGILIGWKLWKEYREKKLPPVTEKTASDEKKPESEHRRKTAIPQETGLTAQQRLRKALKEKAELEGFACYAKLFSKFAKPLQILLGLDTAAASGSEAGWLDQEMLLDTLQEDVAFEMRGSLRRAGGRIENGRILLPLPEMEAAAAFEARIDQMSVSELEDNLRKLRVEIEELQVYKRRKKLVEDLSGVYEKLLKLAQKDDCPPKQLHALAEETDRILQENGVFAMYSEDPRLTSALAGRFGTVSEQQLVYPGLFIYSQNGYRQMSSYSGTRREA